MQKKKYKYYLPNNPPVPNKIGILALSHLDLFGNDSDVLKPSRDASRRMASKIISLRLS
jgi:hypothetical protein